VDDGLGELNPALPSSGKPDARNDDDDEADNGSGGRDDGVRNQQHV